MKRLFIVGCPRSGSTWTAHLLAQHPAVATFQHAKLFAYLAEMRRWYDSKAAYSFIVLPAVDGTAERSLKLNRVLPEEELLSLLRHLAAGVLDRVASIRPGVELVVDKTPENGHQAEFILKLFPDAFFLHVVRDPRSVYCSHRSASRSWARWEFPTRPVDGARFWLEEVATSNKIGDITERYLQVRYEDLQQDGVEELGRILGWIGLPADREFCAKAVAASTKERVREVRDLPAGFVRRTTRRGWREELSRGDLRIIEYLAGALMRDLGYELHARRARVRPARIWLHDGPEALLGFLDRRLHRLTQLMHWGWKGRKLEWNDP